jgi:hypothetical protein
MTLLSESRKKTGLTFETMPRAFATLTKFWFEESELTSEPMMSAWVLNLARSIFSLDIS